MSDWPDLHRAGCIGLDQTIERPDRDASGGRLSDRELDDLAPARRVARQYAAQLRGRDRQISSNRDAKSSAWHRVEQLGQ